MTLVDHDIVEMPESPATGAMPPYRRLVDWVRAETDGLTSDQLDFDDTSADNEWMWWSIRRQVSHIAWDALVFTHRRCGHLLWPDGDEPEPIVWRHHHLGPKHEVRPTTRRGSLLGDPRPHLEKWRSASAGSNGW